MHAPLFVSPCFFKAPTPFFLSTIRPGAALTRKFLHAVGLPKAEDCLSLQKGGDEYGH